MGWLRSRESLARRLLVASMLAGLGVAAALAAGELVARLVWSEPAAPAPAVATRSDRDLPVLKTVEDLMRPGARGLMSNGTHYRSNGKGVRGPEYADRPAPGVFRIVIVGDSVTMGVGVEENDAYPARLETALNDRRRLEPALRGGRLRHEVLNLGMASLGFDEILRRLEDVGLGYHPDLIVYGWTINDIDGPGYQATARPQDQRHYARFDRSPSYLLRVLWPRWVSARELLAPPPHSYLAELRYNYFENSVAWGHFVDNLDRLAGIGRRRHVCVVVFLHAHLAHLNRFHPLRPIYDRVAEGARDRGLVAVPSLPILRGQDERALHVSSIDPHPNRAGHELLAQALLAGLDALPGSCWLQHGDGAAPQAGTAEVEP
jgi:lysophospholipase L1-like esterase